MQLSVHKVLLPKAGLESHECEDSIGIGSGRNRFCVADGATEGFGSRRWSRLLTKYWVISDGILDSENFANWVQIVSQRFARYWQKKILPWYAEEKARKGAFAAFVGIEFTPGAEGMLWKSIAQGDCCLFQVRSGKMVTAYPLSKAEDFNNNPLLIASDSARWAEQDNQLVTTSGSVMHGDRFLLMSDAIAAWFLSSLQNNQEAISIFYQVLVRDDLTEFGELIAQERDSRALKNDDIAVVLITANGSD